MGFDVECCDSSGCFRDRTCSMGSYEERGAHEPPADVPTGIPENRATLFCIQSIPLGDVDRDASASCHGVRASDGIAV